MSSSDVHIRDKVQGGKLIFGFLQPNQKSQFNMSMYSDSRVTRILNNCVFSNQYPSINLSSFSKQSVLLTSKCKSLINRKPSATRRRRRSFPEWSSHPPSHPTNLRFHLPAPYNICAPISILLIRRLATNNNRSNQETKRQRGP